MPRLTEVFCMAFCLLGYGVLLQTTSGCTNPVDDNGFPLCQSRDCVRHASMIIQNMNLDIDPCQDFYSFACGGYKRKFYENDTRSIYDDTWFLLQTQIKDLIENLKPEEGSSSEKLKTVFENCMNVESSEMKSVSDAVDILKHVGIPNWPRLNESFSFSKLSRTLGELAAYGEFAFVNFKPSPYYNTKLANSTLLPPALILQGNFLLNSKWTPKDVYRSVIRILNYFNISKNETESIWKEFTDIENAGIRLQNETGNPLNCKSTPKTTFREVNCSEHTTGSMKFLCDFWRSATEAGDLDKYYSPDILHISCSWSRFHYIDNIFLYLDKISDRSLANYLSLRFFISHLDDLNLYFHLTKRTYPGDKRSRTSEPISRWEYCVGWIIKSMNSALGFEYTQKILTENIQNSVLHIIKDYVQELNNSIKHIHWLDERTKLYLQMQVANLDIGFRKTLDNYRNKTLVESFYKMFSPKKGSFLRNILDYQKMSLVTKEKHLFNSFYSSSDPYTMDFGVALLQPPTFAQEIPKIWNYAALGFVIGHELGHNLKFFFDFVHLDETIEDYLNSKMHCFVQQYSHRVFQETGKTISSSEAKEEFIADNLGWAITENLIKKTISNKKAELWKLPCLDYTPLQLAYISFAQKLEDHAGWFRSIYTLKKKIRDLQDSCAVLSKTVEAEFYASKPQNLPHLRVNGVLQNSKLFSKTFKCVGKDTMNPKNKCTFFE